MRKSDTGHINNVVNFEKLTTSCLSFDGDYNPSSELIAIGNLQNKYKKSSEVLEAWSLAEPLYKNAIAERKEVFTLADKIITRANNAFIACITVAGAIENARSRVRKIRGQRASAKKTEAEKAQALKEGNVIVEHSSSQTSFDSKVDNIDKYIKFLSTFPEYKPNEEDLTIESLNAFCTGLKAKNHAVVETEVKVKAARIKRDIELYDENEGLLAISNKVKAYVKSIYGATSPQFKQISKFSFVHNK